MMKTYFIRFLCWIIRKLRESEYAIALLSVNKDDLYKRAYELVLRYDGIPDVSGEYKRHVAYAQLIKEFPDRDKRDIALAIELGVQRL